MKLLAIDSSTEYTSVCYYDNGVFTNESMLSDGKSSAFILQMIHVLSDDLNDLNGIVYTRGPGAFTGVRIGIATTQGIALAKNIPTLGFSSLRVMEFGAKLKFKNQPIICAIDARLEEVYLRENNKETLVNHREINIKSDNCIGVGSGFKTYPRMLKCKTIIFDFYPQAQNLIKLALQNIDKLDYTTPEALYLRNNIAKKSLK